MAPLPKWQPRRTVYDLYMEREHTRWYWRILGMLSASMILSGFLVFPFSFEPATDITASQGALGIVALVLLALGYSLSVALWFLCTSTLFQFDVLFMPCLSSCLLGLLNIGISLGVHPATKSQWSTSSISALALAVASTIIYSGLSLWSFRKLSIVRSRDTMHRRNGSESINLLPEDELQRQQLLRLLLQKEGDKKSSPASQSTFWIDLPDSLKHGREAKQPSSYLSPPSHVHEGTRRSLGSIALEEQFSLMRGKVQEIPIDRKQQTLDRARERSQDMHSRETSRTPPVIVNTRIPQHPIADLPLSEIHPLEREGFIRGVPVKDEPYRPEGVYRPEDDEYSYDVSSSGRRTELELEDRSRRKAELEGSQRAQVELEAGRGRQRMGGELEAEVVPRIVRVQTDGWPGGI